MGCAVRLYATSTGPYRPLPAAGVGWSASAQDVADARRSAAERNMRFNEDEAQELASLHTSLTTLTQRIKRVETEQKKVGASIPALAKSAPHSAALAPLRESARELRTELRTLSHQVAAAHKRSAVIRSAWPNRMHADVPRGAEGASQVLAVCDARIGAAPFAAVALPCTLDRFGDGGLATDAARDHLRLAAALDGGGVDMTAGITATGPSWPYLLGSVSMLEHALTQYALATALRHGFVVTSVPDVIKVELAERCGFQPRDEAAAQTYFVDTQREDTAAALCLAGTAEIPLAALVANRTFSGMPGGERDAEPLPTKLVALGHAFRAEAGARGADTRGLYRIHQFSKVELFVVAEADRSDAMLEELRGVQESIAQGLGLLYRVVDMASEELGASAYRKYDIEAWMPGRGAWGEISSASNCTDYQAERLAIKYRGAAVDGVRSRRQCAHTLNATAAAVPRLIVALLETYGSEKGGKLVLPASLRPYWLGGDDARVHWVERGNESRPAARRSVHTAARSAPARGLHTTSAPRALQDYRAKLEARAAQLGTDPAALVVAFVLLHELTAIVPLFGLAALIAALGAADWLLDTLAAWSDRLAPTAESPSMLGHKIHAWITSGTKMAARMCSRCDAYLASPTEHPSSPVAVWLASLTAAYVVVKLALPLRIAACFAWSPALARRVVTPVWRKARRVLGQ